MTDENVYVKVEEYKDVIDLLSLIHEKLNESKIILNKIHEITGKENQKLEEWASGIDEIEKKMEDVNSILGRPRTP